MALPGRPHHLLSSLRDSGAHSDLTIKCGNATFLVHKCIVCPQSTFFEKACEEEKWKEAHTGVIELKAAEEDRPDLANDDPRTVKLMVDYLYLDDYDPRTATVADSIPPEEHVKGEESAVEYAAEGTQPGPPWIFDTGSTVPTFGAALDLSQPTDYDYGLGSIPRKKSKKKRKSWSLEPELEPSPEPPQPESFLEMHAKVFAIASKYDIKSLEQAALKKFKDQSKGHWETADLVAAMDVVFNYTPDREIEIRNALKTAIVRCAVVLVQYPGFEEAVASIDGLSYDLFRRKTYAQG